MKDTDTAFCFPALANALDLANPESKDWKTTNEIQQEFLLLYKPSFGDVNLLSPYLKGMATHSGSELSEWFAENGWPGMQFRFSHPAIGIGSIFDLLVDWKTPGKKKSIEIQVGQAYNSYEGVTMDASHDLRGYSVNGRDYPLFEMATKDDGWHVYLNEVNDEFSLPNDPHRLPSFTRVILAQPRIDFSFKKLEFPEVKLEQDVDISWINGLEVEDGFRIDDSFKKIRLRLDDKGARVESAVAFVMRGGSSTGVYKIERPFHIIFWKEGLQFPAFSAVVGPESWIKSAW